MTTFSPRYLGYMASPAWRERRKRALERAGYRCQVCGETRGLQVHHNSYERLGNEADEDLAVLCFWCHQVVTWWLRARRFWKRSQPVARRAWRWLWE